MESNALGGKKKVASNESSVFFTDFLPRYVGVWKHGSPVTLMIFLLERQEFEDTVPLAAIVSLVF